ncbi:MAG: cytochrome c-type biogenesis protein CcmH, partial [Gammaproteobacteria bacterium]
MRSALAAIALLVVGSASWAIDPEPAFDDLAMQAEYQSLIREVRCLVCQNQTIADSNAALAS